jgi:hypothetical protein
LALRRPRPKFTHIQVSEAKEATNFSSNYKEAKKCRAYEAYQLLASSITFSPASMEQLLALVREKLPAASSPVIRGKLSQLLQHAARGVAANPTATGAELASFLGALLEGCVAREEAARARAKEAVAAANSVAAKGGCFLSGGCLLARLQGQGSLQPTKMLGPANGPHAASWPAPRTACCGV